MKTSCNCCGDQISMNSGKIRFSTSTHVVIAIVGIVIALLVVAFSWGISR